MGVQEEVIQELTRFEDVAYNYLECVTFRGNSGWNDCALVCIRRTKALMPHGVHPCARRHTPHRSPSKYFQTRAKLIAKLSRHRTVMDYRQSVVRRCWRLWVMAERASTLQSLTPPRPRPPTTHAGGGRLARVPEPAHGGAGAAQLVPRGLRPAGQEHGQASGLKPELLLAHGRLVGSSRVELDGWGGLFGRWGSCCAPAAFVERNGRDEADPKNNTITRT